MYDALQLSLKGKVASIPTEGQYKILLLKISSIWKAALICGQMQMKLFLAASFDVDLKDLRLVLCLYVSLVVFPCPVHILSGAFTGR